MPLPTVFHQAHFKLQESDRLFFVTAQINAEIQIEIHQATYQENRALLLFPPLFFLAFFWLTQNTNTN